MSNKGSFLSENCICFGKNLLVNVFKCCWTNLEFQPIFFKKILPEILKQNFKFFGFLTLLGSFCDMFFSKNIYLPEHPFGQQIHSFLNVFNLQIHENFNKMWKKSNIWELMSIPVWTWAILWFNNCIYFFKASWTMIFSSLNVWNFFIFYATNLSKLC